MNSCDTSIWYYICLARRSQFYKYNSQELKSYLSQLAWNVAWLASQGYCTEPVIKGKLWPILFHIINNVDT